MLGLGSALYIGVVIGIAVLVIYSGRVQQSIKDHRRSFGPKNNVRRQPHKPADAAARRDSILPQTEARSSNSPTQQ